jgi:putative oxidoreductase
MTQMESTVMNASRADAGDLASLGRSLLKGLEGYVAPLLDLALRVVVGIAFFRSGLAKIQSWETTVLLFENEYQVPLLPPELAAYLGTAAELVLPVLLVAGLCGRGAALALFVFNIVAVISYPDLSDGGLLQHQFWGWLLLVTLLHGPGKLSVDHFVRRRYLGTR